MRDYRDSQLLRSFRDLRDLQNKLLTNEVAEKALQTLSSTQVANINQVEQADLLSILLGRILYLTEDTDEIGSKIEAEIQAIVHIVCPTFTMANDRRVRAAALDILRYLPLRTENEITYALDLANKTTDQQVQAALATALQYATPKLRRAKNALKLGLKSPVEVVRKAVEQRLKMLD